MKKKFILFDFDGTIFDSQILYDIAASENLLKINLKYTEEFCMDYFNGRGWKDVFAEIEKLEPEKDIKKVFADALVRAKELTHLKAKPTVNSKTVIDKLKNDNYSLAICSNSSFNTIKEHLKICQLEGFFKDEEIFALESVSRGKPEPDIYLKAMNYFQAKKSECLVIEDSVAGLTSASLAGIDALFYTGATHHAKNPAGIKNTLAILKNIPENSVKGVISDLLEIYNFV